MPVYEYRCGSCGHKFELMQKFSDPPEQRCPMCQQNAHRIVSLAGFVLKGTGWYVTDYPSSSRKAGNSQESHAKPTTSPTSAAPQPSESAAAAPATTSTPTANSTSNAGSTS